MTTKTDRLWTKEDIRTRITTQRLWTMRAIVVLYQRQTDDEKNSLHTNTENGVGFSKYDSEFLSSLAVQILRTNSLSERQLEAAQKKIGKYAGQLLKIAQNASKPVVK